MRDIKFRAWNTHRKEMEMIDDLYWFEENQCHHNGDNDYVIQQYTGLKDKNWVEIYEGDLLSGHKLPVGDLACEVQFLWGCWYLNAIIKSGHSLCGGGLISMTEPSDTYEVMGNIFEGVDK